MPDKMNLDDLKLLYRACQKYEVMTMCAVGGQPKNRANLSHKATECTIVWLHSSVGRASHRYRGGHGFESR